MATMRGAKEQTALPVGRNEVVLIGRVSGVPTSRTLPSGDELISWRLVVDRDKRDVAKSAIARSPTVDTIDCIAQKPSVQRIAAKWTGGEILEIHGAIRRRFWRGAQGTASRCEVEVIQAKRI